MTVVPSFLVSGILSIIVGLAVLIWAAAFVQKRHGGVVLVALSIVLLLVGGGIFPPLIGLVAGVAGSRINAAPVARSGRVWHLLRTLWPWPLVIFMVWVFGQWIVGYYFNDFLQDNGYYSLALIVGLLPLSVLSGYAHDVHTGGRV